MAIRAVCVDSGGHNTQEAYRFALPESAATSGRSRAPLTGSNGRRSGPARRAAKNARSRAGYRPVIIGVNACKEAVRQRLLIAEPGPGYCHFPVGRPAVFFEQLTAERLVIERRAGTMFDGWVAPRHRANEHWILACTPTLRCRASTSSAAAAGASAYLINEAPPPDGTRGGR